jgi:hypothetical protein
MTTDADPIQPGGLTLTEVPVGELLLLDHVGIAVHDVCEAMDRFGTMLGIGRWHQSTARFRAEFRKERITMSGVVGMGQLGPINIELVQPAEGY